MASVVSSSEANVTMMSDVVTGVQVEEKKSPFFVRASSRDVGNAHLSLTARLSSVIRRSLRLSSKRRPHGDENVLVDEDRDKVNEYFTSLADVRIVLYDFSYGDLAELKGIIRLQRHGQLKKFIRQNNWPVGHSIRLNLWKTLCYDNNWNSNLGIYESRVEELAKAGVRILLQQSSFLSGDGVVVNEFRLNEQGTLSLQRLLAVVECVRPDISCIPILYPLAALFLHYMSEKEAFACISFLLRQGSTFIVQTRIGALATNRTLLSIIKNHKSAVYKALRRAIGSTDKALLAELLRDWPQWIYRQLPFEYVVRISDCFLTDGLKLLLRVAVAIVLLWKKRAVPISGNVADETARCDLVRDQLEQTAANCSMSVDALMDMAYSIRNLKSSNIARAQKKHEETVIVIRRLIHVEQCRNDLSIGLLSEHRSPLPPIDGDISRPSRLFTDAFASRIVHRDIAADLLSVLPSRLQLETPLLLFRLTDDGTSFRRFWEKVDQADQSLLVIRADNGQIFGAFCSASWSERRDRIERTKTRYFGTGETFVWKVDGSDLTVFKWIGSSSDQPDNCPHLFMTADDTTLIVGSGGGDAIAIRDELSKGMSAACQTFASPPLAGDDAIIFSIDQLEVFAVLSG